MDKRKFFSRLLLIIWVASLLAVLVLFAQSLCSCSASQKSASQSYVSVDSVSVEKRNFAESVAGVTAHSSGAVSVMADSVVIFQLRIAPEQNDPPDSARANGFVPRMSPVLPAFAASLYGVRLDMSNDCSSSLALSDSHVSSEAASALSRGEASKESAESEAKSPSSIWGIIVFIFLILAVLMLMRYLDR